MSATPVWWKQPRAMAALLAMIVVLVGAALVGVVDHHSTRGPTGARSTIGAGPEQPGEPLPTETPGPSTTAAGQAVPAGQSASAAAGLASSPGGPVTSASGRATAAGAGSAAKCTPADVHETGITTSAVTIGQVVSDASFIPQQLGPVHEGLQAWVNQVNGTGGVCGRKVVLDYQNDAANPSSHNYAGMTHQVFAFVGSASLLDSQDYQSSPPFNPVATDNNEYVPDIGGFAFAYNRSQSPVYAGVFGSLSPTLISGEQLTSMVHAASASGRPCTKPGVVYLRDPTGIAQDQAALLVAALEAPWGANLGSGVSKEYAANPDDPVPSYELLVSQMKSDGRDCVFSYLDQASAVNLAQGAANQGMWPPSKCVKGAPCFSVLYVPFSAYGATFIHQAGAAAEGVSTYVPHVPVEETGNPALQPYLSALKSVSGAEPSTFSVIGYSSGVMFGQVLAGCGPAPTRACVLSGLHALGNFDAGGLIGPVNPFQTTTVNYSSYGTFAWKWIFKCSVGLQVEPGPSGLAFRRVNPAAGFACGTIHVARGTAA